MLRVLSPLEVAKMRRDLVAEIRLALLGGQLNAGIQSCLYNSLQDSLKWAKLADTYEKQLDAQARQ